MFATICGQLNKVQSTLVITGALEMPLAGCLRLGQRVVVFIFNQVKVKQFLFIFEILYRD
jgi:hypothetical protein